MQADITSVTVCFGNGIKREEYGPVKKAEVTITASVVQGEEGAVTLATISHLALAKVADLLSAPKPDTVSNGIVKTGEDHQMVGQANTGMGELVGPSSGEAPARRTRGPNKAKEETPAGTPDPAPQTESKPEATPTAQDESKDEWAASADDIVVSDAELLSATSKRAGELGARDPIVKLIATFATRTEGAPFKVQEIPSSQRKDYLAKLATLAA